MTKKHNRLFEWNVASLRLYDQGRELFRPASTKVVRAVLAEYVKQDGRILEIGSGAGELTDLVPELKGQIQQTDVSMEVIQENRRRDPNSNIRRMSVYDIRYGDGSFDSVVGYASFDTLTNLEDAFSEVGRVLTDDGTFIHFLDLEPSANVLFDRYEDSDYIVFPRYGERSDGLKARLGFQLIKKNDFKILTRAMGMTVGETAQQIFEMYEKSPEIVLGHLQRIPQLRAYFLHAQGVIDGARIANEKIDLNADFKNRMTEALRSDGFEIVQNGKVSAHVKTKRKGPALRDNMGITTTYSMDVGSMYTGAHDQKIFLENVDVPLARQVVKAYSTLQVIVAQKK